ncbi:MAG: TraR/DksA C4-type zinc finger protein [Myxococcaceae bacterium]
MTLMKAFNAQARNQLLRRRDSLLRGNTASLGDGERVELTDIDAALARLANGRYGDCERCGGPIGMQRLRAMPEARVCLSCREET